jgi:hypothetical protein
MTIPRPKKILAGFLFMAIVGQSSGALASEETCDKVYVDYLLKAKQALQDNKPDEAVAFLRQAATIAESCAKIANPEGQGERNIPAPAASIEA